MFFTTLLITVVAPCQAEMNRQENLQLRQSRSPESVIRCGGNGMIPYNDNCYYFSGPNFKTWDESNDSCRKLSMELVSITSHDEQQFVSQTNTKESQNSVWIGLYKRPEGGFTWSNGSPFIYQNWEKGEPSLDKIKNENCVEMYPGGTGTWNDIHCITRRNAFVCKSGGAFPYVDIAVPSYFVDIGVTLTLECNVISTIPLKNVQWHFLPRGNTSKTTIISKEEKYSGNTTASNSSLSIINADKDDAGIYICTASNEIGAQQSTTTSLLVQNQPLIHCESKRPVVIQCNTSIIIESAVYGRTNPITCPGEIFTTQCVSSTSYEIVSNDCAGQQECKVYANNNVYGNPCTRTYKYLNVSYQCAAVPYVVIPESFYLVLIGKSVTLKCFVNSNQQIIDIRWKFWKHVGSSVTTIKKNDSRYSGGTITNPSLTIVIAEEDNAGTYACLASNTFGSNQSEVTLLVVGNSTPSESNNKVLIISLAIAVSFFLMTLCVLVYTRLAACSSSGQNIYENNRENNEMHLYGERSSGVYAYAYDTEPPYVEPNPVSVYDYAYQDSEHIYLELNSDLDVMEVDEYDDAVSPAPTTTNADNDREQDFVEPNSSPYAVKVEEYSKAVSELPHTINATTQSEQ